MDPLTPDEGDNADGTWPERALLFLAMVGIALLCAIVTITVVSRTIYRPIIPDDVLLVREVMVAAILLPLAVVTAGRTHIAVTIFTNWTSTRTKVWLSLLGHLVGTAFAGLLMFAGWRLLKDAWLAGEYFDGDIYLPSWIGYATFVLAMLLFVLRLLAMLCADIRELRDTPHVPS
ncbi:MAG: TRAP transporter small permease [Paracoccaceae bacterium]